MGTGTSRRARALPAADARVGTSDEAAPADKPESRHCPTCEAGKGQPRNSWKAWQDIDWQPHGRTQRGGTKGVVFVRSADDLSKGDETLLVKRLGALW
jgi:hypothetical protein